MIVSPVHLIFPFGPRGVCQEQRQTIHAGLKSPPFLSAGHQIISKREGGLTWDTGSELIGELGQQVVVYPVFHGAQDDDGSGVVNFGEEREMKLLKGDRENTAVWKRSESSYLPLGLPSRSCASFCLSLLTNAEAFQSDTRVIGQKHERGLSVYF